MAHLAAIKERDWPAVRACLAGPLRAEARLADAWGYLPLHRAAYKKPPLDVVAELLLAHPDAASTPDVDGDLPLHLAAEGRASLEVVTALLEAHPAAASKANIYGRLPLHYATWHKASVGVVAALLAAYPEGAAVRDASGALPGSSRYPTPTILAALKAAAAARRWRAPIAWHMWHRM